MQATAQVQPFSSRSPQHQSTPKPIQHQYRHGSMIVLESLVDEMRTVSIVHCLRYDTAVAPVLPIYQESVTRGNSRRLVKNFSRYDMRKYSFTQRIVNIIVCLNLHVVNSSSVNSFKNNLDKFWVSQEVYYNFKCDITGTGNRSLCQLE